MEKQIKQGLLPRKYWAKDVDGNLLKTYRIGKFLVTENLKTEHYNDGTPIPILEDPEEWRKDTSGAMCYYDNNRGHKEEYGGLYNDYAVATGKLALLGWILLLDDEWKAVEIAAGMSKEEADKGECWRGEGIGDKLKKLLEVKYAGYRYPSGGGFYDLGTNALWWSSSVSGTGSWDRQLNTSITSVCRHVGIRSHGFSVRCVRELTQREIDLFDNLTISDAKGENEKQPKHEEKREFTLRDRIFLKLLLLAMEFVSPLHFVSEIDEIKKMLK